MRLWYISSFTYIISIYSLVNKKLQNSDELLSS